MGKRIVIFFTGGTISMVYDPAVGAAVPALSGREILARVPGLEALADLEVVDFGRFPGPHMTPARMLDLSARVRAALDRPEVDGAVVTHGTDTLEETAYLLDLTADGAKPVVFVGAMRNSSEPGWDGPSNLLSAVRVAASEAARGLGVLVVMNETILAAAEATKVHTEAFDAFRSPDFGPLGVVDKGAVLVTRAPLRRARLRSQVAAHPVWLLKMSAGFDPALLQAGLDAGVRGLVIEGLGRGNVPPDCVDGIARAIAAQIPVVMVSRCLRGRVYESYGYPGGGKQLRDMGVIFADFLNGPKARIKLSLVLGVTRDLAQVRARFEPAGP